MQEGTSQTGSAPKQLSMYYKMQQEVWDNTLTQLFQSRCFFFCFFSLSMEGQKTCRTFTRSFILQLCAKALEPSIFSRCLFFMKARGSFQSFMSASSSSARPMAGEWSKSESIFIRALQRGYQQTGSVSDDKNTTPPLSFLIKVNHNDFYFLQT